jgi:hypothetical protein
LAALDDDERVDLTFAYMSHAVTRLMKDEGLDQYEAVNVVCRLIFGVIIDALGEAAMISK